MSLIRKLRYTARHRLGTAFHDAGGATRSDVLLLRDELGTRIAELSDRASRLESLDERVDRLELAQAEHTPALAELESLTRIDAVTRWIRQATLSTNPLVSVVMPTCERPDRLERAIASVVASRYQHWELLVVDDGAHADSRAVVETAGDQRISWRGIPKAGTCAARNAALDAAAGEIVAYADDDNTMDPEWLYAVAWALEQRADAEVLYGAFVVDDVSRLRGDAGGAVPRTYLHPWSREALLAGNLADIGAIAHRAGLPEARFDENLREMGDWDLLLRLTAEHEPLVLPAIACYYTTDAPGRITQGPTHEADRQRVIDRAAIRTRG